MGAKFKHESKHKHENEKEKKESIVQKLLLVNTEKWPHRMIH